MMPNLQSFLTKFNRSEFEGFVLKCKRYTRNDVKQYYHIFCRQTQNTSINDKFDLNTGYVLYYGMPNLITMYRS